MYSHLCLSITNLCVLSFCTCCLNLAASFAFGGTNTATTSQAGFGFGTNTTSSGFGAFGSTATSAATPFGGLGSTPASTAPSLFGGTGFGATANKPAAGD